MDNRRKGHNYERKLAKDFRNLGFTECITTRQGSRLLDSCGVDLMNLPFIVQAKAVIRKLDYEEIFDYIDTRLKEHKITLTGPKLIFHKFSRRKNGEYVIMTKEDFMNFISQYFVIEDE